MADTEKEVKAPAKKAVKKAAVKKATVKKAAAAASKPAAAKAQVQSDTKAPAKKAAPKKASVKKTAVAAEVAVSKSGVKALRVTLTRSKHGRLASHKACVAGLGLRRMHQTVEVIDTPENRGMINRVHYMLNVEEV